MKAALVVFAKAPRPGLVKTRLQPLLSPDEAADLYEASLRDVLDRAQRSIPELQIAYDPTPDAEAFFISGFPNLQLRPQVDGDLGQRLDASFDQLFREGFETVAVIGADSPTLPVDYLHSAFDALHHVDVVLGPSEDGGYYLVGLSRRSWPTARSIFQNVPWSTRHVLTRSIRHLNDAGLTLRLLPTWYDIDLPDDLVDARRDASDDSHLGRWLSQRPPVGTADLQ